MLSQSTRYVFAINCLGLRLNHLQRYHSIHARGERVEDTIKAFESNSENVDMSQGTFSGPQADAMVDGADDNYLEELEDGELDEGGVEESSDCFTNGVPQHPNHGKTSHQTMRNQQSSVTGIPAAVAGGVQNEALKNLMMSWYYAGYYTGFYEGQKAATDTGAT